MKKQITQTRLKKLQNNKTPCEITWLDITAKQREEIKNINEVTPTSLLTTFKTYGVIYKYDNYGVIILTEFEDPLEEGCEVDYTCIPIINIINIQELKGGR